MWTPWKDSSSDTGSLTHSFHKIEIEGRERRDSNDCELLPGRVSWGGVSGHSRRELRKEGGGGKPLKSEEVLKGKVIVVL